MNKLFKNTSQFIFEKPVMHSYIANKMPAKTFLFYI